MGQSWDIWDKCGLSIDSGGFPNVFVFLPDAFP